MARILIVFSSFDGQTARIAGRVGDLLRRDGHTVTLRSAGRPSDAGALGEYDAVILGGAVRYGRHAHALEKLARGWARTLPSRPNAFFSVSLSAAREAGEVSAQKQIAEFCRRSGWQPGEATAFAGALPYRRYNPLLRLLMRLISGAAGGDIDTSRDYEYTDWQAVERFAARFSDRLRSGDHELAA